jgi:hypothetical protein
MTRDHAQLLSDDELLGALAASFPVDPVEPDAAQLYRLSMAVAELREKTATAPAHPPATTRRPRWTMPRRLSPVVLAGAAIGVLGAGTGISYAVGVPLPAAVRAVARTVGLAKPTTPAPPTPTTLPAATSPSPAAAATAARQAESTLHQALTQSDPPPAVISHDSAVLAHRLVQVGGDRAGGEAGTAANGQHLLNEACRQLEAAGQAATGSSSDTATGGATFPGCGPVGIWHYPSGSEATSPSSGNPSSATRTTDVPSSSHSGGGTGGGPFKAPAGGSSGISPGGTRTNEPTGTTPQDSPGHDTGGSSEDRSGHGTSSSPPSGTQNSRTENSDSQNPGPGATDPRSGATSG